ncbi:hypothetical protein PDIDSM_1180 [Penicillium digitatum]|nr:hypothetical protein PDIDSM_1180 [Penicillium digitatum]
MAAALNLHGLDDNATCSPCPVQNHPDSMGHLAQVTILLLLLVLLLVQNPFDANVVQLPFGLVMKWTDRTSIEEVVSMQMADAAGIPVPKVDPTSSLSNHVADNPRQPENRTVEPTFHSLPAVASQSHTSLDEHIGAEEDVMQASYNIEDFTINSHEIDISSAIPEYQDSSPEAVRNLLIEEAQDLAGDHTTTVVISVAEIRDRVKQVIESNIVLRKEAFSHIAQNTDVRDSFKKLRATYAVTSHQHSFARYTKWTDLRFKNGTASEFVRKFQETLRDLTSIDGKINSQALIPFEGTATKGQIHEYQTKIGTLIWLMVSTRPDISFAVIKLAKHAKNPSDVHFQALKRVFRYLTGTKLLTISFHPSMQDAAVCGYCDADWAGPHSEKGLSTSGFLFKMAGGVFWTSKKQPCVALSTTESEYIAESLAVQEAIWLTQLLTELGIEGFLRKPIPIYADNNGAIALASNPEFHAATKHIAIRFHRLREEVAAGNVKFVKIPTADMAADGLTKPLAKRYSSAGSSKWASRSIKTR